MPNLDITIQFPILTGSEKFKVRYRLLPSGSFSAYQDETNALFTLSGLTAGDYEVEIIFVTEEGLECPATYQYHTVLADFTCWDFLAVLEENPANSGLYNIKIDFSGSTQPLCGWEIEYTQGTNTKTVAYPTLPATNVIRIPVPNATTVVTVYALLCNGVEKECYTVSLSSLPPVTPCIGLTIDDTLLSPPSIAGLPYSLFVLFTDSTPPTKNAHFTWQQVGTPLINGQILDSGTFFAANYLWGGTSPNLNIWINQLYPIPTVGQTTYNVRMLDQCGTWHSFTVVV